MTESDSKLLLINPSGGELPSPGVDAPLLTEAQTPPKSFCGRISEFLGMHLKSIVFGGTDGVVTAFTIVAGSIAMNLSGAVVLALGFVSIIGDGLGMGAGDYISSLTEDNFAVEKQQKVQQADPDELAITLAKAYKEKGASSDDAMQLAKLMQHTPDLLCEAVLANEYHMLTNTGEADESPLLGGVITFCSFMLFGAIPLMAFMFDTDTPSGDFIVASCLTLAALLLLGALQGKLVSSTTKAAVLSALKLVFVGCLAATAAWLVGYLCDLAGVGHHD